MQTPRRRRSSWAILASVLVHLGLLTAVLLQRPVLTIPVEPGGPPEAIIPILILPRAPPRAAGQGARPAPIQLHRRPQRNLAAQTEVAPLIAPIARPAESPAPTPAPVTPKALLPPAAGSEAVRATLRATLGCAEIRAGASTRDDRAGCLERFGRGARDEAYLPPALPPEKRALLDEAGAAKLAQKAASERPMPPGHARHEAQDYSGEPDVATNVLPPPSHPPSKRAAQVLNPLPP